MSWRKYFKPVIGVKTLKKFFFCIQQAKFWLHYTEISMCKKYVIPLPCSFNISNCLLWTVNGFLKTNEVSSHEFFFFTLFCKLLCSLKEKSSVFSFCFVSFWILNYCLFANKLFFTLITGLCFILYFCETALSC